MPQIFFVSAFVFSLGYMSASIYHHGLLCARNIVFYYICVAEGRDHCKTDLGDGL